MSLMRFIFLLFVSIPMYSCGDALREQAVHHASPITPAADITAQYLHVLVGKRVAVIANQTSVVGSTHLVDTLLAMRVNITCVFAPEHGFRGDAGAGETIRDGRDPRTGLPVYSLYGKTKKPTAQQLSGVDVIVFDIQDVGARFYTYISTMHYAMEAAAELGTSFLILDRPNPNGFYVDGPVLERGFSSFVGMHPIPVVHGCTVGELALMINGEGWLDGGVTCDLTVIPCSGYTHQDRYVLPVSPSPNLREMGAIYLYPSLCFFEGTVVSVGRGTDYPFQVIGFPGFEEGNFTFTPADRPGVAMDPPHEGKVCRGHDLRHLGEAWITEQPKLHLSWLLDFYRKSPSKERFFDQPGFFDKLAGTDKLRKQIQSGQSEEEIRATWKDGLEKYRQLRQGYLLYPDFQ